jgi:hypothetical protein
MFDFRVSFYAGKDLLADKAKIMLEFWGDNNNYNNCSGLMNGSESHRIFNR